MCTGQEFFVGICWQKCSHFSYNPFHQTSEGFVSFRRSEGENWCQFLLGIPQRSWHTVMSPWEMTEPCLSPQSAVTAAAPSMNSLSQMERALEWLSGGQDCPRGGWHSAGSAFSRILLPAVSSSESMVRSCPRRKLPVSLHTRINETYFKL